MALGWIIAVFPSRSTLVRALDFIHQEMDLDIKHSAIIAKAQSGETIILDDDISADEGGVAGGALGAAMGVFGVAQLGALLIPGIGPLIAMGTAAVVGALIGGATGRFAASLMDFGFKNNQLEELAHRLNQEQPVLILELDYTEATLEILRTALLPFQVTLIQAVDPGSDDKKLS
ncbi:hypothetical protein MASR2M15_16210 [Anaerolineales bacterium]